MKIENVEGTIVRCIHRAGTSKSTLKSYSFYSFEFVDTDYTKHDFLVPRAVLVDGLVPDWIFSAERVGGVKAFLNLDIKPFAVADKPFEKVYKITCTDINRE